MRRLQTAMIGVLSVLGTAGAASAATLDGSAMSWPWALPFAGLLLSIAIGPPLLSHVWHDHYGKAATAWAVLAIAPIAFGYGISTAAMAVVHAVLGEYLSFVVLLAALYTVAGGILITGDLRGTTAVNAGLLAFGTAIASIVGTTGAAMILIRPLMRANAARRHNVHVIIFFIILVANIGGALSPLGDPPLFVGFLRGIDFFWPLRSLWLQTALTAGIVLAVFAIVDLALRRREGAADRQPSEPTRLRLRGGINLLLMVLIIGAILVSALWQPGIAFSIYGTELQLQNLVRDGALIAIAGLSLWLTREEHRAANGFSWEPIREVAILFAGIFVAIIPVLAMLQAGREGSFAFLLNAITVGDGSPHEAAYFWLTGTLSSFLDNAPTYLVFFELAGGDARELMGPLAGTLAAISMGAVYMGSLTYIGNAPNLMVFAIAKEGGIAMPSFFAYFCWAALILVPTFLLLTLLPISPILKLG